MTSKFVFMSVLFIGVISFSGCTSDDEIKELRAELVVANSRIDNLIAQVSESEEKVDECESQVSERDEQVDMLLSALVEANDNIVNINEEVESAKRKLRYSCEDLAYAVKKISEADEVENPI
jgi:chromosome segregation ATPase